MVTPGFIWNACLPSFAKPRCEAADRPQTTENPEEGSGTVLAVGIIAALLILATVIIGFAGVSTANRRAAQAADLAALAAADALFPANALKGPRYNAFAQAQIDTELLPDEELA